MQRSPQEASTVAPTARGPRYILITQCLQNDFFLNRGCRLCLPPDEVKRLLVGVQKDVTLKRKGDWFDIPADTIDQGPLAQFFKSSVGRARKDADRAPLYVINIRDWHEPGHQYNLERRLYGPHCLCGTRGSAYVKGLNRFLDPPRAILDETDPPEKDPLLCEPASYFSENALRIHHVHSDSLFDFVAREQEPEVTSRLADLLNLLVYGSDQQLAELDQRLGQAGKDEAAARGTLRELAEPLRGGDHGVSSERVYVAVVGVYTDIKVQLLLSSIQSRYKLENVVVSDSLTASATLDRHLAGLDFAAKVLGVDVVHTLDDLLRFLNFEPTKEDDTPLIGVDSYADHKTYFLDKQSVLAHRNRQLEEYIALSQERSIHAHRTVRRANQVLLGFGVTLLGLAVIGPVTQVLHAFWGAIPEVLDLNFTLVTGGLGLIQVVTVFFAGPMNRVYRNLVNLMMMRVVLENHSMKTSLARFHLTSLSSLPQALGSKEKADEAKRHVELLEAKVEALRQIEQGTYEALQALGFSDIPLEAAESEEAAPEPAAAEGPAEGGGEVAPAPETS